MEHAEPRPTSLDVARLAGVSRSTVSQILNGNGSRFPEETRTRVTAAACRLNYRPSRAARALVSGVSDLVVLVVPTITFGRSVQEMVENFSAAAEAFGLNALVRYGESDLTATITTILDLRPRAVFNFGVLNAAAVAELEAAGTQVMPRGAEGVAGSSRFDEMLGRMQAAELLKVPQRRLIYAGLADPRVAPYAAARAKGVKEAVAAAGGAVPDAVEIPLQLDAAIEALAPVLQDISGPIGVACYNDEVAIAVLTATRYLGLSVPDEVGVIGLELTQAGQFFSPRLATIGLKTLPMRAVFERNLRDAIRPGGGRTSPGRIALRVGVFEWNELVTLVPGESC
ncbi:LacI family transcriptional regulator [Pseudarthrobacter sp. R1]|uniref:substrate-binding domain-containing protein n=1 Tax=Pseudarthrobacter sp. R1 TaxID=2944934 RepID=UPI0021099864|nr:LacI family DNA-binding transcriptional regulator [Pseudarthrobacter sp. R1]MCQ6271442.1 LacI family transcriptional regulator [Pseudarthrobacter sp. R1]